MKHFIFVLLLTANIPSIAQIDNDTIYYDNGEYAIGHVPQDLAYSKIGLWNYYFANDQLKEQCFYWVDTIYSYPIPDSLYLFYKNAFLKDFEKYKHLQSVEGLIDTLSTDTLTGDVFIALSDFVLPIKKFDINGTLIEETKYDYTNELTDNYIYNSDGKIICRRSLNEKYQLEGVCFTYFEDAKYYIIFVYDNGKLIYQYTRKELW